MAAVSRAPSPLPMMKMAAQKPPNDLASMHGQATRAPMPIFLWGQRGGRKTVDVCICKA